MKKNRITTFKVKIDSVKEHAIGFELFAGNRVNDNYVNIINKGTYNVGDRLVLTPKQFKDFCHMLIAYVYYDKESHVLTDKQLKILWNLKLNIYNHEAQQLSKSIFKEQKDKLKELNLLNKKDNR